MTKEEFVNKVKEINPDLEVISDFLFIINNLEAWKDVNIQN